MPKAGKLDERITFQERTTTPDGGGGSVEGLANISSVPTVWAHVMPGGGSERTTEGRVNAEGSYKFVIRYRADINETHTILWRGSTYNIRNVQREGPRPLYLYIETERGVRA